MHQLIQLIHLLPKPIFSKTASKKPQLTWSYVFSISNLHSTPTLLLFNIESIASIASFEKNKRVPQQG